MSRNDNYLYELKNSLLTDSELAYLDCIESVIPDDYLIIPQSNLATFIHRTDGAKYQNELFRNVDFLITDCEYRPRVVIEINDSTHNEYSRRVRDERVQKICEEAGISIITLWTSYGINPDYIGEKIRAELESFPPERKHHFVSNGGKISAIKRHCKAYYIGLILSIVGVLTTAAPILIRNLDLIISAQEVVAPSIIIGIISIICSFKVIKIKQDRAAGILMLILSLLTIAGATALILIPPQEIIHLFF
ncbi:MAG: DUF2726 domain-containing protein [Acutalibacteraceae bacterium]